MATDSTYISYGELFLFFRKKVKNNECGKKGIIHRHFDRTSANQIE